MTTRGRLIAFEGVEGAGKSTQIGLAAAFLRATGQEVVETREPGGTPLGRAMRQWLLHDHEHPPAPMTELLLYLADRAQHVAELIAPALTAGKIVLTDRFSPSTLAYQAYARGLDLGTVRQLDAISRQGIDADLVLLFDCPPEQGLRRALGDDRFHREALGFHERVRQGFLQLAVAEPQRYRTLDATAPASVVTEQVKEAIRACLGQP